MNTLIQLPTEKDIENAASIGRKLSEIWSVSLACKIFGEAMVAAFSRGLQKARIALDGFDWELEAKKARRRAKYQRRYKRIGERMKRQ